MKRDVDIKRFTQMSCCLRHNLFQGISDSSIMYVTLTSARRCATLSCSLETSDILTTGSVFPGLEDLKCMIVDNIKPYVDRFVFPDVHRVIVLLQADHLPTVSRHQQPRSLAASASYRNEELWSDISLQSNMECDVYICKELYAMSCCQVARPRFR